MLTAVCETPQIQPGGEIVCPTGWVFVQTAETFSISMIDPVEAAAVFGAGFFLPLFPMAVVWGATQLVKLLR